MILTVSKTLDGYLMSDIEQSGTVRERTAELQYAIRVIYKEIAAYAEVKEQCIPSTSQEA